MDITITEARLLLGAIGEEIEACEIAKTNVYKEVPAKTHAQCEADRERHDSLQKDYIALARKIAAEHEGLANLLDRVMSGHASCRYAASYLGMNATALLDMQAAG